MNTKARVTVARTADRAGAAAVVRVRGSGARRRHRCAAPRRCAGGACDGRDRCRPRSSPRSSDPSRCIPTTSSRLFSRRRHIRCKSFKQLDFWRIEKTIRPCRPIEDWDDSIVALLNYPEVVKLLNDDLDWTYDFGTAVLNQRADVLNAIQDRFAIARTRPATCAATSGRPSRATTTRSPSSPRTRRSSTCRTTSRSASSSIRPRRSITTIRSRYPVYYYPYPAHYAFDTGSSGACAAGSRSAGTRITCTSTTGTITAIRTTAGATTIRSTAHNVYVNVNVNNHDHVWQPHYRYGGRPVVRGYEGRVYTANTPRARHDSSRGVAGSALRNRTTGTAIGRRSDERRAPNARAAARGRRARVSQPQRRRRAARRRSRAASRDARAPARNRRTAQPSTRTRGSSRAAGSARRSRSDEQLSQRRRHVAGARAAARASRRRTNRRRAPPARCDYRTRRACRAKSSRGTRNADEPAARARRR